MPRPWSEYSRREWRRLKPLLERNTYVRHQAQVAWALRQPPAMGDLAAIRSQIAVRRVLDDDRLQ